MKSYEDFRQYRNEVILAVYMAVYLALFFLVLRGPANRRNRNDNTSGTAAILELTRLAGNQDGVAYILFDDEEKGKKGCNAFAAAYPEVCREALVVNLDCVGNGDTYIFCISGKAEANPLYTLLRSTVERQGLNACFFPSRKARMNSDQKSFPQGIGVCTCRYRRFIPPTLTSFSLAFFLVLPPRLVLISTYLTTMNKAPTL